MTSDVLRIATEARTSVLGPFRPSFNVQDALIAGLDKVSLTFKKIYSC